MDLGIKDKIAIVGASSKGLGKAVAFGLAGEGVRLTICSRGKEALEETTEEIKSRTGAEVLALRGDVSKPEDVKEIVSQTMKKYGTVHILVNNAGIAPKERRDILDMSEESFDEVLSINLKGAFFLAQQAANWMIEQKKTDKEFTGCIINITSVSAVAALANRGEYCISKAGRSMVTQLLAVRLGDFDIPVYEVRPGIISTDMTAAVKEKYDKLLNEGLSLQKRWGFPDDVGKAVSSLAVGNFPYSTGQVIMVDGGLTLRRF